MGNIENKIDHYYKLAESLNIGLPGLYIKIDPKDYINIINYLRGLEEQTNPVPRLELVGSPEIGGKDV